MRAHPSTEIARRDRTGALRARARLTCLALGLFGLSALPCGAAGQHPAGPYGRQPVILVGLELGASEASITCDGVIRLWRRGSGLRGSELERGARLSLAPAVLPADRPQVASAGRTPRLGISVKGERRGPLGVFAEDLILEPLTPGKLLQVGGRSYRGEVVVRLGSSGKLTIINAVRIEDYLRGVVPAELGRGPSVPSAALQAQAIAARSYALFYLGRHADRGFDLIAGPADQVYEGVAGETPAADAALEVTRGMVATYAGRPIRANYSSTCGGRTASSGAIWPGEDYPYLVSVADRSSREDLCRASPHYRWTESWPAEVFQEQVLANLKRELPAAATANPTRIKRLEIKGRTPSGRVATLAIRTDRGTFVVHGDRTRWVLRRPDGRPLRSTQFGKLKRSSKGGRTVYTISGAGYGHGVGLCQFGAMELARRGASASQILAHYYRGIDLVRWW